MVQTLRTHLRSVYFYGPKSFLTLILIGFGFVDGAFLSACLGGQFAFRFPPVREWVKI